MSLAVWADSPDVPIKVCVNARLRGEKTHPKDPNAKTYGQGGWDIGLHFTNLSDLASQVIRLISQTPAHICAAPYTAKYSLTGRRYCPPQGLITRLAINAHGVPGTVYAGGSPRSDMATDPVKEALAISPENIPNIIPSLKQIYYATAPDSTILLMGCLAGQHNSGNDLLKSLSTVWPDRRIVAFTTVGYQWGGDMLRPGQGCAEPGMRDSMAISSKSQGSKQKSLSVNWNNLLMMPWATEESPGAKVFKNGVMTKEGFL